MRILVLCYEYPPIGGGGGRVAKSVAEQLVLRGHEVRVQTAALGLFSEQETINGVQVFRTASGRQSPDTCRVPEMGVYLATSLLPVLRQCTRWGPDVIHAHFAMPTGVLALAVHRLTRIPYVLTAHLGDVPGGVPEQTDRLFRYAGGVARQVWKHAAGATAVSDFVRKLAERAYERPVQRILNGVDLTHRPPRPAELRAGPRHLVFLGRLNAQKNAPLLLDALARIPGLPWRLTVIGDGPDMGALRQRIAQYWMAEKVKLAGWRNAAEVADLLNTADVLCMPSSSEGMPVAAVEALRHGLALAGTDIPGLRDVLAPGANGLTAPVGHVAAYANILRTMLTDGGKLLAFRQASWDKAADFDLPKIAAEYEAVLERCRRRGAGARLPRD
ncbi:MAG TPA: glycosyltransferase family 4 protein [Chthoniobacteraceae bacterium]|jgi:glycosyltransferase involved in cell wall biosynthesis|nr:glycosyltransferase family 4 protein [Chthoniobacteraceae bacterium]